RVCASSFISHSAPISLWTPSPDPPRPRLKSSGPDSGTNLPHVTRVPRMGVLAEVLLFAAAWFGHAFLLTVCLNWWYAQPLRRRVLTKVRLLVAILVFAFPVLLAW